MSFQPEWAESVLIKGTQFELRRTRCGCEEGTRVLVYTSKKVRAVTGVFEVGRVLAAPADELYPLVAGRCGVGTDDFFHYLANLKTAYAIEVVQPRLLKPFKLEGRGPMSFRYLDPSNTSDERLLRMANIDGRQRRSDDF
jgi:predicted transcriptional regulator